MPDNSGMEVLRSADRFATVAGGISTRHTFSYGAHYDPTNVGFGDLVAINDERIAPGHGYGLHSHADVEIVTWVLAGTLAHEDTTGHRGTIEPGVMQRLSAGRGVRHSERNASQTSELRFLQMMVRSDNAGDPAYAQVDVDDTTGELLATVTVDQSRARLHLARLQPGGAHVSVPAADLTLIHVCRGEIVIRQHELGPGDSARLMGVGPFDMAAEQAAEVLVWQLSH